MPRAALLQGVAPCWHRPARHRCTPRGHRTLPRRDHPSGQEATENRGRQMAAATEDHEPGEHRQRDDLQHARAANQPALIGRSRAIQAPTRPNRTSAFTFPVLTGARRAAAPRSGGRSGNLRGAPGKPDDGRHRARGHRDRPEGHGDLRRQECERTPNDRDQRRIDQRRRPYGGLVPTYRSPGDSAYKLCPAFKRSPAAR